MENRFGQSFGTVSKEQLLEVAKQFIDYTEKYDDNISRYFNSFNYPEQSDDEAIVEQAQHLSGLLVEAVNGYYGEKTYVNDCIRYDLAYMLFE